MENPPTGREAHLFILELFGCSRVIVRSLQHRSNKLSLLLYREVFMTRTAAELAEYVGGRLEGDPRLPISGIASPERATGEDLIYLDSLRHADRASESAACCV